MFVFSLKFHYNFKNIYLVYVMDSQNKGLCWTNSAVYGRMQNVVKATKQSVYLVILGWLCVVLLILYV